jgi:hypothetical protein
VVSGDGKQATIGGEDGAAHRRIGGRGALERAGGIQRSPEGVGYGFRGWCQSQAQ